MTIKNKTLTIVLYQKSGKNALNMLNSKKFTKNLENGIISFKSIMGLVCGGDVFGNRQRINFRD